jgi:hypothetical protein
MQEDGKFQASLGYIARPSLKKSKEKRSGSVVQVVEHLPGKHEALVLIPSTRKEEKTI